MDWGFKKIPFTLCTYVLAKILQNGAKFRYAKAGFKNYRNLNNFRQAVESPKSWNLMGFCPKKYIPSAKTYTVDLSNITFNYLCVDSPNYLCHFWNHKSFFTTQLLWYLFSSNITFFLQKRKFSDFSPAQVKVHQIPHAIFQKNAVFLLGSFFSVIRDNFSALFRLKLYMLLAKAPHQSANFQTCHSLH